MRTPTIQVRFLVETAKMFREAAIRAVKKLEDGQALDDVELLGVVALAHQELLKVEQVWDPAQKREMVQVSTTRPVEAVKTPDGVVVRRLK